MYLCHTNSFKMKRSLLVIAAFTLLMLVVSCGKSPEKKLIGTWKVGDVQTEFNETEVTPEMLRQVVEMQKQTHFRIINDSTMVIISNNNTHEAYWELNSDDNAITYYFRGMETTSNKLGVVEGNQIVNTSNTPLGVITIYYEKE